MKKNLCLLVAVLLCVCLLTACAGAAQADTQAGNTAVTVTAADGFENYGYVMSVCGQSGYYDFTTTVPEGSVSTWSVYLLDEEFTDAARYIPHANSPALEGSGMLYIEKGRYIYTSCSCSAMSASEAEAGLEYTYRLIDDAKIAYSIASDNSFDNCGFTNWLCDKDGTYSVRTSGASVGVAWRLYVLDEQFPDADRYITQAYDCTLESDGQFTAKAGQYIYVQCLANDFTTDGPVSGGMLIIQRVGD